MIDPEETDDDDEDWLWVQESIPERLEHDRWEPIRETMWWTNDNIHGKTYLVIGKRV